MRLAVPAHSPPPSPPPPARSCGPCGPRRRRGTHGTCRRPRLLHAYGASERARSTVSSSVSPSSTGQVPERPSSVAVRAACEASPEACAAAARRRPHGRSPGGCGPSAPRALQGPLGVPHQPQGTAQEPAVDVRERQQRRKQPRQALLVEAPLTAGPSAAPPGQHRDQLEPLGVAVLQVRDLVQEHRRRGGAVTAHQAEARFRFAVQQGRRHGQDRGDAAAADDCREVPGTRRQQEPAHGLHDLDGVPHRELLEGVRGELAAVDQPDAHAEHRIHPGRYGTGADRVGTACLLAAGRHPAQRDVLARRMAERVPQLCGDREGDGHGVVGEPLDFAHPERMEHLQLLEVVEGLPAGRAAAQCLARGGGEPAEQLECRSSRSAGSGWRAPGGPGRRPPAGGAARCRTR